MGYKDSFKEVVIKGTIYDSSLKLHDPLVVPSIVIILLMHSQYYFSSCI